MPKKFRDHRELYQRASRISHLSVDDAVSEMMEAVRHKHQTYLHQPMGRAVHTLFLMADYIYELRPFPGGTLQDEKNYCDMMERKLAFYQSPDLSPLQELIWGAIGYVSRSLPTGDANLFEVPALSVASRGRDVLQVLYNHFYDQFELPRMQHLLVKNFADANGIDDLNNIPKRKILHVHDCPFDLEETLNIFFADTPIHDLFSIKVPMGFPEKARLAHTHVLGGSGAGKTTLLMNLLAHDFVSPDQPSVVVIDPHLALIPEVSRLKLNRRTLLIDPLDLDHPPAINIFDVKGSTDPARQEQVLAGVVKMLSHFFGETNTELTGKQNMVLQFICRMLLLLPETMGRNATVLDVLEFVTDPKPYQATIDRMSERAKRFFRDFRDPKSSVYRHTAEHIRYRLDVLFANPTLERLFSTRVTKLDLRDEIQNGSIIFISTAQPHLKDGHKIYGKLFISMVLEAAMELGANPNRRPTYLYVDEAENFLDETVEDLLRDARKFRLGCILAHQDLGDLSAGIKAKLASSTAIKVAAGVRHADATVLAHDMRTTADFLMEAPEYHFAAFVKGETPYAIYINAEKYPFADFETMSDEEWEGYLEWNRRALSHSKEANPVSPAPDEDVSSEW